MILYVPHPLYAAVKAAAEAEEASAKLAAAGFASQDEAHVWLERITPTPLLDFVEGTTPGGIHWYSYTWHGDRRRTSSQR